MSMACRREAIVGAIAAVVASYVADPTSSKSLPALGDAIDLWVPPRPDLGMGGEWVSCVACVDGLSVEGSSGKIPFSVLTSRGAKWKNKTQRRR